MWYNRALADTFRDTGPSRLAEELEWTVVAIEDEVNGGTKVRTPPA